MLNYKNSVLAVLSSSQIVKLETTGNGDEGGFNAVTKPVVWVQITVKKNIELTTKIFFIWNIQLVKNYGCFFSLYLWRFPCKNGFVLSFKNWWLWNIEEPWKIWKLVFMSPNQKNESGTNCWLTGPGKSAAVLSNEAETWKCFIL